MRSLLDHGTGDDQSLDLVRALIDLTDLGISHVAFDRVILQIACTAETCTASVVTFIAMSDAKVFIIEEYIGTEG